MYTDLNTARLTVQFFERATIMERVSGAASSRPTISCELRVDRHARCTNQKVASVPTQKWPQLLRGENS